MIARYIINGKYSRDKIAIYGKKLRKTIKKVAPC